VIKEPSPDLDKRKKRLIVTRY